MHPTKRRTVGSVLIVVTLAGTLGLGMLSFHRDAAQVTANEAERTAVINRAAVIQQYFDAVNRTDPEAALAMFAEDAVFIGSRANGSCSQQTPCSGRATIGQQLEANARVRPCFTLREIQVTGAIVTGRYEVRADPYPGLGIERIVNSFIAFVPQDTIGFLANVADVADPQTATYVAVNAGQQAPTPLSTPRTPCAEVS
jgi:ketosteroid isomerase-like protein